MKEKGREITRLRRVAYWPCILLRWRGGLTLTVMSPLSVSYVYAEKDMLSNLVMVAERSFPEQLWDVLSPERAGLRTWPENLTVSAPAHMFSVSFGRKRA